VGGVADATATAIVNCREDRPQQEITVALVGHPKRGSWFALAIAIAV
jgi:hypothetical protein